MPERDNNRYSVKQEANHKADHTTTDQDYGWQASAPENNYFGLASLAKVITALYTHNPEEIEKLL
jgi:hypothetical protein